MKKYLLTLMFIIPIALWSCDPDPDPISPEMGTWNILEFSGAAPSSQGWTITFREAAAGSAYGKTMTITYTGPDCVETFDYSATVEMDGGVAALNGIGTGQGGGPFYCDGYGSSQSAYSDSFEAQSSMDRIGGTIAVRNKPREKELTISFSGGRSRDIVAYQLR